MDYLPHFLKHYNLDLQPTNSELIDIESAKDILYPGAHIATSNPYEHFHHGIVHDPNASEISIIHFWGPEKTHGRIQITTLPIFLAGGIDLVGKRKRHLYLVNYENDTPERREETLKIAEDMLGKADEIAYDLATSNCEHFACLCRTGQWKSEQVERIKNLLIIKALEIYEKIKNADEKNRHNIASLVNSIPTNALSAEEKFLYDQFCQELE
jgi:hypothetical protein